MLVLKKFFSSALNLRYISLSSVKAFVKMPVELGVNSDNLVKVFFYGTLKRNQPNDDQLLNRNVTFLSEAVTVDKWPLIIASEFNLPFLLFKKGVGKYVHGEMYLIDQEAKEFFDDFEGIHDNFYSAKIIEVKDQKTGTVHQVTTYMMDNFKEELINENTIFFENYSSKNQYYPEYQKRLDRPENVDIALSAVKKNYKST